MRHRKHRHSLGVKKEHRLAMMASLATALFQRGAIQTTLAKAKALRPFSEKILTFAKKAAHAEKSEQKLHYRRLALARVRDKQAVKNLFDRWAKCLEDRLGGYTRITKLGSRHNDAAPMAMIEILGREVVFAEETPVEAKPTEKVDSQPAEA